jgi:hypothetical protein
VTESDSDSDAFIEQLKTLLADRERAANVILQLTLEKEKLETELAEWKERNERSQKLALDLATKRDEVVAFVADLKDKERARSKIIDSQQTKLDAAEKRMKTMEDILARVEDELHDFQEEDAIGPLEEIEKESLATSGVIDEHETEHTPLVTEEPVRRVPKLLSRYLSKPMEPSRITSTLVGSRCAIIRTLAVVVSVPFLLMASLYALASQGIYVQFFYDLMAGRWEPWMGSPFVIVAVFMVPIASTVLWFQLCRGRPEPTYDDGPEFGLKEIKKPETDEVGALLDEVFGK